MRRNPDQLSIFDAPEQEAAPSTQAPVVPVVSQERIAEIQAAVDDQETPPRPAAFLVQCAAACGRLTSPEWAARADGKCSVCSPLGAERFLRSKWAEIDARQEANR